MKIAILGAGKVGRALGLKWAERGHQVVFGVRDSTAPEVELLRGHAVSVAAVGEAVAASDVVLLSIPSKAIRDAVASLPSLTGKILFDCSNPQSPANHGDGLVARSLAEEIAEWAPGSKVVKIFNSVGFEVLGDPSFNGVPATMFFCCDGAEERDAAARLAADAGFEPVLAGPLKASFMLEELTRFWGALAYGQKLGRGLALKLLVRKVD
jgi:hypothetical protein